MGLMEKPANAQIYAQVRPWPLQRTGIIGLVIKMSPFIRKADCRTQSLRQLAFRENILAFFETLP